jgi:hypothetical protein
MKKSLLILGLLFFCNQLFAQTNWERFWKQSCPIKTWVLLHPFKAKKAFLISKDATKIADSIAKTSLLDKDVSGGQVDAFRHAYWMAKLHQEIGRSAARSLGKAHERDNYKSYKKHQLEDGVFPDFASQKMDLFNNKKGLTFSIKNDKKSNIGLIYKIINAIKKGDLKVIKKDKEGNYLTCNNELIPKQELNKWNNKKCLITSNYNNFFYSYE